MNMPTVHMLKFALPAAALLLLTCRPHTTPVTRQNFSPQYKTSEKILRPQFTVYNVTDSMARLYFTVKSDELLYTRTGNDERYTARILVSYILHPLSFPKSVTDSGSIVMNDQGGETDRQLAGSVDMDVTEQGLYFLEVVFRDLNKSAMSFALLHLDHRPGDSRNNFLVTHRGTDVPLFRSHADSGQVFNLHYYKPNVNRLFVRYFRNRSGPAPPPYAPEKTPLPLPDADSAWTIDLAGNPDITLPREGWYFFSTSEASGGGFCMTRFHAGYPEITLARQLLYPLRYLTTKTEYMSMDTASNVKVAVDNFWLKNSGSQERARELIRNYYNRVGAANLLFGTEKEGWKTDCGMVYLIFGPPGNVYRNSATETWIYSNDIGGGGISFVFDYKPNAPTDREYILQRSMNHKSTWIQAVDAWRQGHAFTLR
jgi:GWxTD domain-containing protein